MSRLSSNSDIRRIPAYAAIYLLWGGAYLAIHVLVGVLPPFLAAGLRYSLAAVFLLLVALLRRDPMPDWRQLLNALWTGAAMLAAGYGVIFWAERQLPSWIAAVIASTTFLWTYLGESLVLRCYRIRGSMLVLLFTGLAGVLLLLAGNARIDRVSAPASIVVLLGAISWSAGSLAVKRLSMPRSYIQTAGIQLAASGLILLCLSVTLGELTQLPPAIRIVAWRPILAMAYLVIAASVVAFAAFHWLMAREPASLVATSTYINPVVAMLLGIVAAHERCSPQQLMGAATVLGSTILIWYLQGAGDLSAISEIRAMPDL